ncbi:hypothetical protein D3C76_1309500 [compost metagenome]
MIDDAEQLPALIDDLETFQLAPVELAFAQLRQLAARHQDLEVRIGAGNFSIVQSLQLRHQDIALHAPTDQLSLSNLGATLERPAPVIQQVVQRIGKGIHPHLATNAMH